ncbi:MAG TPA: HEAT repeat domain-containing protein [Dehalococcoidia bacterium]|nr:HEAT repeat domain-containing protein [Dehalococcoidia bacterium]
MVIVKRTAYAGLLLIVVLFASPTAAAAQARDLDLAKARQAFQAGHVEAAWSAVNALPESPETLAFKVEVASSAGWIAEALTAYDGWELHTRRHNPDLLAIVATAVARNLAGDSDPAIRVEACRAVLQTRKADAACGSEMRTLAEARNQPDTVRLGAVAALAAGGAADKALMMKVVREAHDSLAIAAGAAAWPPAVATPVLIGVLSSGDDHAQYAAALALGEIGTPEAASALRAFLARKPKGVGQLGAILGLARCGDRDALAQAKSLLPLLGAGDQLHAIEALAAHGDPGSTARLSEIAGGSDELQRLNAAKVLLARDPTSSLATHVIESGLASGNPWVRAQAIGLAGQLGETWRLRVRTSLLDSNPLIAARACQAILAGVRPPAGPSRVR